MGDKCALDFNSVANSADIDHSLWPVGAFLNMQSTEIFPPIRTGPASCMH